MQGKRKKVKNFPSQERKQSKNRCSPVKLENNKNDKKIIDSGRDRASDRRGKAMTRFDQIFFYSTNLRKNTKYSYESFDSKTYSRTEIPICNWSPIGPSLPINIKLFGKHLKKHPTIIRNRR